MDQSSGLPLVDIRNVTVRLGNVYALHRVGFCVYPGQHWVVVGPNGAGKSTLLRLIAGELRPEASLTGIEEAFETPGVCRWGFEGKLEPYALSAKQHVRLVSPREQERYVRQGWKITGLEVILSSLENAAMLYGQADSAEVGAARGLAAAAGAEYLLDLPVPAMSQGQLRLALILRAVFAKPRLLLLDEPFDGLDGEARETVFHLVEAATREGVTFVCTAHRDKDIPPQVVCGLAMEEGHARALPVAELVRVMRARETGESAPKPERFAESDRDESRPAVSGPVASCPDGQKNSHPDELFFFKNIESDGAAHTGVSGASLPVRNSGCQNTGESRAAADVKGVPTLLLRDVDVFIERVQALYSINWTVMPGEHWLVTGGNGAGKSTLMRLVYGEEFVALGGRLEWFGQKTLTLDEIHARVGYVSDRLQQTYGYDLTGLELVVSGFRGHVGLYHEPDENELRIARDLMEFLGVAELGGRVLSSLSSGLARRFLLARALTLNPSVLLLDEPCSGLDGPSRKQFLEVLPRLAATGIQIICVSHHPEDRLPLFSHELALDKGKVAYEGERRPGT